MDARTSYPGWCSSTGNHDVNNNGQKLEYGRWKTHIEREHRQGLDEAPFRSLRMVKHQILPLEKLETGRGYRHGQKPCLKQKKFDLGAVKLYH